MRWSLAILGTLLCAAPVLADGSASNAIESPITTTAARPAPRQDDASTGARDQIANFRVGGRRPDLVELRVIVDQIEFGQPLKNEVVWIARYTDLLLSNERGDSTCGTVELVFNRETGALLLAYTPPKEPIAARVMTVRDPDVEAARAHWRVEPVEASSIRASVADVLKAIWQRGVRDPFAAGQVVLRPRRVSYGRLDPETNQPLDEPRPTWIVELLGFGPFHQKGSNYFTGYLGLVDDATKKLNRVRYMP